MNFALSPAENMSEMSAYLPPGTYSGSMKEPQSTMSKVGSFAVSATDCLFTMVSHSTSTRFTLMPVLAVNSGRPLAHVLARGVDAEQGGDGLGSAAFFSPGLRRMPRAGGEEGPRAEERCSFSCEPPLKDSSTKNLRQEQRSCIVLHTRCLFHASMKARVFLHAVSVFSRTLSTGERMNPPPSPRISRARRTACLGLRLGPHLDGDRAAHPAPQRPARRRGTAP